MATEGTANVNAQSTRSVVAPVFTGLLASPG